MHRQAGKRIVSKGTYVKAQVGRGGSVLLGGCLWFVALLCVPFVIFCCIGIPLNIWNGYVSEHILNGLGDGFYCLCGAALAGSGFYFFSRSGSNLMKDAADTNPGVPLTRANTAELPAPDSLVRASEAPVQEQGAELLRAAVEGQETPAEQLLKPVEGEPQQCYVVVVRELDVRGDNSLPFFEMLAKTQNYSDRQMNNLFTWALHVPFMEPPELRIPANSQAMAETLARSCETMGGVCTIQPIVKEAYDWLFEGIGGEKA